MPKISALDTITSSDDADQLPINDVSAVTTKKLTLGGLLTWLQSKLDWITTAMIANSAVTPAKMAFTKTTDANGWTKYDYGTFQKYCKKGTTSISIGASAWSSIYRLATNLPVGMATIGSNFVTISAYPGDAAVTVAGGAWSSANTDIGVMISNQYGAAINTSIAWSVEITTA